MNQIPPDGGSKPIPWRLILPVTAAVLVLSLGAVIALAVTSGGSDLPTGEAATTATNEAGASTTRPRASTTGTGTAGGTTTASTTSGGSGATKTFIASLDALVTENNQLEQQGVAYANQINASGAAAITDKMLADIDAVKQKFLAARAKADKLQAPPAFSKVKTDFLQLNAYNTERCQSLYDASVAWRAGGSTDEFFNKGQAAKAAYQALYPVFEQEYAAAKAGAQ